MTTKENIKHIIDYDCKPSAFAEELVRLICDHDIHNYVFLRLHEFDKDGHGHIEAVVGTKDSREIKNPHYELLKGAFSTIIRHFNEAMGESTPETGTYAHRQMLASAAFQFACEIGGEVGHEEE